MGGSWLTGLSLSLLTATSVPLAADVKFISNPPSMVAAGSVVAAMQGLNLGSPNNFLSCYRTTHFLSRVIKCDPVSKSHQRRLQLARAWEPWWAVPRHCVTGLELRGAKPGPYQPLPRAMGPKDIEGCGVVTVPLRCG